MLVCKAKSLVEPSTVSGADRALYSIITSAIESAPGRLQPENWIAITRGRIRALSHSNQASVSKIQVVLVMSTNDGNFRERAQSAGAAAFLKKPFYPADVDAVLRSYFGLRVPGRQQ